MNAPLTLTHPLTCHACHDTQPAVFRVMTHTPTEPLATLPPGWKVQKAHTPWVFVCPCQQSH